MSPDLLESAEIVPVDEPVPDEDAGASGGSGGSGDLPMAWLRRSPRTQADASDARPGDTASAIASVQRSGRTARRSGADFCHLHASLLANAARRCVGITRVKAITVSMGGRQVDVLVDGAMPEGGLCSAICCRAI